MTDKELAEVLNIPEKEVEHIDPDMKPILYELNRKGYHTISSCQGIVTG